MKVKCKSLKGKTVMVDSSDIAFRVSVYSIVKNDTKVLLVSGKTSGKYWFPGGGVAPHETLTETLSRELIEETGITIKNPKLIHFKEEFFYHDVWQEAFNSLRFYYSCSVDRTNLINDDQVLDGESEKPRWVDVKDLSKDDFDQQYGFELLNDKAL